MTIRLTQRDDGLELKTPYNAGFVADLKVIPSAERRWEPDKRVWLVAPQHGARVADLIKKHYHFSVSVPDANDASEPEARLLKVLYIGRCKDRSGDERTAFGYCDGEWSVVLPEPVLKKYFWAADVPSSGVTLYSVLGIARDATAPDIKKAYHRMARQWHPDVCDEPDAREQFLAIKDAYELLSDHGQRARYDAGLALEATLSQDSKPTMGGYRAPLRCGWLLAEGRETVGRFVVARILQWEDIKDERGRVMVASWPRDASDFEVKWT